VIEVRLGIGVGYEQIHAAVVIEIRHRHASPVGGVDATPWRPAHPESGPVLVVEQLLLLITAEALVPIGGQLRASAKSMPGLVTMAKISGT